MSLEMLKLLFPMPSKEPEVPINLDGWFGEDHEKVLDLFLPKTKIIVEAGSWLGKSSRYLVENSDAEVICIDTWLGSTEHFINPVWRKILPTLHETFLKNLWSHRDRIVPMRITSDIGLILIHHLKIKPDLIYLDAAHDYYSVLRDIAICVKAFPGVPLVGDDITWAGVKKAVESISEAKNKKINIAGNCWWFGGKE